MANVWAWNDEMRVDPGLSWSRRASEFFVFDPRSGMFAPAKFCAFLPVGRAATMTHQVYESLGEQDARFDGHVARRHLVEQLAFTLTPAEDALGEAFERWAAGFGGRVGRRKVVTVLVGPRWW